MEIKKVKKLCGRIKVYQVRINTYVGFFNMLMLFYIFSRDKPLGFPYYYWLIIIGVSVFGLLIFDLVMVIEESQDYLMRKSKSFRELCKDVKEIKEKLR